ncbi:hypothetical protein [Kordiimonas sp.]|uniref:hypothetical protein n=1 Tax=Kordiimonas sp. TaxID=1970157 RepID=UPI003A946154
MSKLTIFLATMLAVLCAAPATLLPAPLSGAAFGTDAGAEGETAGEPLDAVFGTSWGMTLALDGTGFYNELIGHVLPLVTDEAAANGRAYVPLPYKRAKMQFEILENSCIYPATIEHLRRGQDIDNRQEYIETSPMLVVESHIFSRPGMPPLTSMDALANRTVAYPNGSSLPVVLKDYNIRFVPTTDENTKARMLIAGRVDHMSGSLPDNIFVFQALGHPLPPYNPDLSLLKVGVGIVCHRNGKNEAFVAAVNAVLAKPHMRQKMEVFLRDKGVAQRFLPPHVVKAAGAE